MGRELRRVPLDFRWPEGIVWRGYISPYRTINCKVCEGTGFNVETKAIADAFYSFGDRSKAWYNKITQEEVDFLIEQDRLRVRRDGKWCSEPRTAEEVNAEQDKGGFSGHDGINRMYLIEYRAKKLGVYGTCGLCEGAGYYYPDPSFAEAAEAWEFTEPPTGEGYQLWETTSEGSPASPVFKTLDELCEWCAGNATTFGSAKTTKESWKAMLQDDFVVHKEGSMIFI